MKRNLSRVRALVPAALAVLVPGLLSAQEPEALELATEAAAEAAAPPALSDVAGLEAWLDGFMASHLEELPSAGAAVAIVLDGAPLLARGYGLADVEEEIPVEASTLFRIGSVSKLFTWTAVMQLVERGILDLETDINEYMGDVQVPATYAEPITLRHLLTHTAGFEDHVIGLFGSDEDDLRPLEEILREEMPARVRPPGEVASYSNHGTGMAAYIVERVTGMPFAANMRENLLEPLGMEETTILQPVPEPLAGQLSLGYSDAGHGEFEEEDFEYVPLAPVGAVSSSADDMARLMIAYLQDGRLGDARILTEETARRMRRPLFRHADGLNAALYGFMDMSQMGQTIYGHGGDTFWFHTLFALLPEHDVGVFLSYNTDAGAAGRERFLEAFLERYFPVDDPPELEVAPGAVERAERYAGNYRVVRYTQTDFTKIVAALGPLEVSADSGALTIDDDPTRYLELSPGLYREEDGHGRIAFRDDEAGEPAYLFIDPFQIIAFERVDGVGSPTVQATIVLFCAGLFALAVIFWPYVSLLRWRYGATPPEERRLPRWARVLSWIACLGFLVFAAMFGAGAGDPNAIAMGDLEGIRRVLTVGLVAALLGAITAALGVWFWLTRRGSAWTRVVYCAVGVACLLAIWQMSYWNLLGFRL